MPYGSYKDRQVKVDRTKSPQPDYEAARVWFGDESFPNVGRQILILYQARTHKSLQGLSGAQLREICESPVATPNGNFPSPEQEYQVYPVEWTRFIANLHKMPAYKKQIDEERVQMTAGVLIKLIRGYHWEGGWLKYRPVKAVDVVLPEDDGKGMW